MASPTRGNIDLDDDDEDDQSTFVFPFAVLIAECLHIVDNLACEINNVLEDIEYFLKPFQMLATMLHDGQSRQRFFSACVARTEFARYQHLIKGTPTTVHWRWGVIVQILHKFLPISWLLRATFNARKYMGTIQSTRLAAEVEQETTSTRSISIPAWSSAPCRMMNGGHIASCSTNPMVRLLPGDDGLKSALVMAFCTSSTTRRRSTFETGEAHANLRRVMGLNSNAP